MEMDMINTLRRNKMITGVLLLCLGALPVPESGMVHSCVEQAVRGHHTDPWNPQSV